MNGTWCRAKFIPEKLTIKMQNNGRQHPSPQLKLLLVLEQSLTKAQWIRSCVDVHTL